MSDTPRTHSASAAGFSQLFWESKKLERELTAAQAEIARLKAGGCARDQRTTQFCGEALKLQDENARLQERVKKLAALGNTMADFYGDVAIDSDDDKRIEEWRKAVEDTP